MRLRTAPGSFLAAAPDLRDPNFMHAVVLIGEHGDEGAYGLIVNRAAPVTLDVLLPEHPVLGSIPFPIFTGGPVGLDTLQFVHRAGDEGVGGLPLADGLFLGGDLEALATFVAADRERALHSVRLFVGYSGWGAGQLDDELASGSWLPAPGAPELVFGEDEVATWRRVVRSIGGARGMADLPPDVSWN
jgi:putative transcriptional regulator